MKKAIALFISAGMLLSPVSASALSAEQAEGYAEGIVSFEKNKNHISDSDSLLSGDIAASLFYHPAVLYFAVFYIVFMLRMFMMLRFNIGKVSYKRVVFFIWLGIALILIRWAAKNIALYLSVTGF